VVPNPQRLFPAEILNSVQIIILDHPMEEINPNIQGIRMARRADGTHHLILIASNALWADVLHHTLGTSVLLGYTYDGNDITFYVVVELPHIGKLFRVPVSAHSGTLNWISRIDEKIVTGISVTYRDGKGGAIPFGQTVQVYY
jgi:hypothetical protein